MSKQYRMQIPDDLLEQGFPVEWIVIDESGTVVVHYTGPHLLANITVDDRFLLAWPDNFRYQINTGQTVEFRVTPCEVPQPFGDDLCKCGNEARCNANLGGGNRNPITGGYRRQMCDMPASHRPDLDCGAVWRWVNDDEMYAMTRFALKERFDHVTADNHCLICGRQPVTANLVATAERLVERSTKNPEKLERLLARMKKKARR